MNDLLHGQKTGSTGPVECLGQTFPSEHARREYFVHPEQPASPLDSQCLSPGTPLQRLQDLRS